MIPRLPHRPLDSHTKIPRIGGFIMLADYILLQQPVLKVHVESSLILES